MYEINSCVCSALLTLSWYIAHIPDRDESGYSLYWLRGAQVMYESHQKQPEKKRHPPANFRKLKIALASPNDVLKERRIFFRTITEVNTILRSLGKHLHLDIVAWENVRPDAGRAQRVVSKQLSIDECDIFVAVFWTRFGMPTGDTRPADGKPYLSGTEQEIDEAFEARRKSGDGRPTIMLYRKKSVLRSDMSDEDHLQYNRVIEFFKQTAPGGRYEALYAEFRDGEFKTRLREHLLQAVQDIGDNDIKTRETPSRDVSVSDPKQEWLEKVHLTNNPFETYTAESDSQLTSCYFPIGEHRPRELVREPKHWFLFAAPGCGKTALSKIVETQCFPRKNDSETIFVRFGQTEIQRILMHQPTNSIELDDQRFLRNLIKAIANAIGSTNRERIYNAKSVTGDGPLADLLQRAGLEKALCVLDQVDELKIVSGDPARIVAMIKPIILQSFREPLLPYLAFRYLLPASVEAELAKDATLFRLDRCRVTHMWWSVADLRRLLQERLSQSADTRGSLKSLGQLCDSANGFAAGIDEEIAKLAEGCPRAAIWLADRLIEIHCQAPEPERLIREETWVTARQDWWRWGRRQILGVADRMETFWMRGDVVCFGEETIRLTRLSTRLMQTLIEAGDTVCSRDNLKKAGWPDESAAGVTERALSQAITRLRNELSAQGFNGSLVHVEHGRGYRLLRPQSHN